MKETALYLLILLVSLTATAQNYTVRDNCSSLIVRNVTTSVSNTYIKQNLYVDFLGGNLNLRTTPSATIVASWTRTSITYLAPTIDSGYKLLNHYLQFNACCMGLTGPTGPTGGAGAPDTVPVANGRYLPAIAAISGVITQTVDTASWSYINHLVTVTGAFGVRIDTSLPIPAIVLSLPLPTTQKINGVTTDSTGGRGSVMYVSLAGQPLAYVRLYNNKNASLNTYKYTYTYSTDTTVSGYVVHAGPTGPTGATPTLQSVTTTDSVTTHNIAVLDDNGARYFFTDYHKGYYGLGDYDGVHNGAAISIDDNISAISFTSNITPLHLVQINAPQPYSNNTTVRPLGNGSNTFIDSLPVHSGIITHSVNGIGADTLGNITLTPASIGATLQAVTTAGNTTTTQIIINNATFSGTDGAGSIQAGGLQQDTAGNLISANLAYGDNVWNFTQFSNIIAVNPYTKVNWELQSDSLTRNAKYFLPDTFGIVDRGGPIGLMIPASVNGVFAKIKTGNISLDSTAFPYLATKHYVQSNIAAITPTSIGIVSGSASFDGDGATTTFTVTTALGSTPSQVLTTATSPASSSFAYVTNKTATTFDIVFLVAPVIGTGNVTFDWVAYK
jgi:hypothetical protein